MSELGSQLREQQDAEDAVLNQGSSFSQITSKTLQLVPVRVQEDAEDAVLNERAAHHQQEDSDIIF